MPHLRWSTGDKCVMPYDDSPNPPLTTAPCAPVGDLSQAWQFETLDIQGDYVVVRIHFVKTGTCLARPRYPAAFGPRLQFPYPPVPDAP